MTFISLLFFGIIRMLVKTENNSKQYEEIKEKQLVLKDENKKIKEKIEINKILKQKIEDDEHGKIKRARELLQEGQIDLKNYRVAVERANARKRLKDQKINNSNIATTPSNIKKVLGSEIEDTI